MIDNGIRRHDKFYENEDRSQDIKHMFKVVMEQIKDHAGDKISQKSICDVGCASGDFLYAVKKQLPIKQEMLWGVDILENLLAVARKKVPGVTFDNLDISSDNFAIEKKFDYVCFMGVLQIFDKPETPINNLLSMVNSEGMVLVAGPFNKEPVSLITRYYNYSSLGGNQQPDAELGWNIFCFEQLERCIVQSHPKLKVEFVEINFPKEVEVEQRSDDPLRSWTVSLDGKKKFLNGNGIIQSHYVMKIFGF